jgi:hypothetical protein
MRASQIQRSPFQISQARMWPPAKTSSADRFQDLQ